MAESPRVPILTLVTGELPFELVAAATGWLAPLDLHIVVVGASPKSAAQLSRLLSSLQVNTDWS